jgi:hypothetical protein
MHIINLEGNEAEGDACVKQEKDMEEEVNGKTRDMQEEIRVDLLNYLVVTCYLRERLRKLELEVVGCHY